MHYKVVERMITDLYRWAAVLFGIFLLAGCTSIPQYQVTLQEDFDNNTYTLWVADENGKVSSLQYSAWSSHFLKRFDRDDVFMLERLKEGETPVFFSTVPRIGLEPTCREAPAPETSVSTISPSGHRFDVQR